MQGKIEVVVKNRRINFRFTLERNITIINGNSATGKTTLINMVRDYENLGESSGVTLNCSKPCRVLEGLEWRNRLETIHNSIVFIDEGNTFLKSKDFAREIRHTDNYYVIATREPLYDLPYSIDSIFKIKKNQKYPQFEKIYKDKSIKNIADFPFDVLITEDRKSGYQFFCNAVSVFETECYSADGKSNFIRKLDEMRGRKVLIVADAAALGPEIAALIKYQRLSRNEVFLFLPESFEWLILKSGLLNDAEVQHILDDPSEHINCEEYFSWEKYFEKLLINRTNNIEYMRYQKSELADFYMEKAHSDAILNAMR